MFDPITPQDSRDDVAGYTLDTYDEPDYRMPAERGKDRADAITAALLSGDWSDVESWDGVHVDTVHTLLDPTRRGESITYTTPAPPHDVATVSERKTSRGKKGTKVRVTTRGRVLVVGDSHAMDDSDTRTGRVPRRVIAHAIDRLRDGNRFGHVNGDALAKLTTTLYDVPDLIGTDHYSWSEGTPEIAGGSAYDIARHTCGISGGMSPVLDAATGPEYRTRDDSDPRWFPAGWTTATHVRQPASRLSLPAIRVRSADPVPRETVVMAPAGVPWRTWYHVREIPAPAHNPAYAWHGHRRVLRGESKTHPKVSANPIRDSFTIGEHDDPVEMLPLLAAIVREDGKGKYAWRVDRTDVAGTLTVDKRGRVSITGPGIRVTQAATLDALRRSLAV